MGRVKRETPEERLHRQLARLHAVEEELQRDFEQLMRRASRIDFGGLGDHGSSADASGLGRERAQLGSLAAACSVADALEAWLMQYGDRTSRESRAKGLASILAARPDWAALISDEDRRRILDAFAMNDEVDSGPSLISGAPVRGSEASRAALAETTRTLYGPAQAEALALGGGDLGEGTWRYHRLRTIAKQRGLKLTRPDERKFAEQLMFDEIGASASQARTWDEGMRSLVRAVENMAGRKLNCAESNPQDVARRLAELRPDLVEDYRGGRDKPPAPRKPRDHDGEAMKLSEAAKQLCCDEDVPLTPENMHRARVALARRRGGPNYGSRGKD